MLSAGGLNIKTDPLIPPCYSWNKSCQQHHDDNRVSLFVHNCAEDFQVCVCAYVCVWTFRLLSSLLFRATHRKRHIWQGSHLSFCLFPCRCDVPEDIPHWDLSSAACLTRCQTPTLACVMSLLWGCSGSAVTAVGSQLQGPGLLYYVSCAQCVCLGFPQRTIAEAGRFVWNKDCRRWLLK